ncbi:MAG: hypothetical protein J2P48_07160 [Alphaproteobacteria bacterium]|nr:hypothetical protein [Alphaproteobacteria bacterium]
MDRRNNTRPPQITYRQLGAIVGHPHWRLHDIVGLTSWWSEAIGKQKLSMLVVDEHGHPGDDLSSDFWRDQSPLQEYFARLARLLAEDWTGITAPTLAEMTELYQESLARNRARRNGQLPATSSPSTI